MVIIELDCETVHNGDQQFACWGVIYYLDRRLKNDEAAVLILQLYALDKEGLILNRTTHFSTVFTAIIPSSTICLTW